jgi:predicted site-specific integrase-resolvase
MKLSTREASKKLGISYVTLASYVQDGKVPSPETAKHGSRTIHLWTEEEIELVRKLLPKIANGRKTRYKTLREEKQKGEARSTPRPKKKKT